jgi:fumarylacetoacetate (FAA) hydrolase family protein
MKPDSLEQVFLPEDGYSGTLIGRAWLPNPPDGGPAGPSVVAFRADGVYDISQVTATTAELCNAADSIARARTTYKAERVGTLADILANTVVNTPDPTKPYLLTPIDLQCVKAAGVTFVRSMLERVIEESAKGDPIQAESIREHIIEHIGTDLSAIVPGSEKAAEVKEALLEAGMWSQYLEVGIGPDAEIFTKCPIMACVGFGAGVGIHPKSTWNNPEPEIVLVVNNQANIVGATLGNDVNLRDFEGRSSLLLSKAKDNNASSAIGPFIRLFDESYQLDNVRSCNLSLSIEGGDGFTLIDGSSLSQISRDIEDLVHQTINENHQYPDGFVLFTGTMFAPTQGRQGPGLGFTHTVGDVVEISTPKLGTLRNTVHHSCNLPPWTFGVGDLMRNLAARNLI